MRLFEAILEANNRAVAGDANAGVHPGDFAAELPVVALTCIDPRLNPLMPEVLGIPEEQFIWLRNAGNIITGPMSSTTRSLSLACAIKGGKEIAIIGHTDCQVAKTSTMVLLDNLKAIGVERRVLPENLNDFFGMFASERQNVIKATDIVRRSPLIGPKIPVHGLLVDIQTGKLDWIVNGYQSFDTVADRFAGALRQADRTLDALEEIGKATVGEIKFPETKVGEAIGTVNEWLAKAEKMMAQAAPPAAPEPQPPKPASAAPPRLPPANPVKFKLDFRKLKRPGGR